MIYNYLSTNLCFLKNGNKGAIKNLKNNFLYLIHHKFNHKYQNSHHYEFFGNDNRFLFYTGIESDWEVVNKTYKLRVENWLKMVINDFDPVCLKLVKIKLVSKQNQKSSILALLYTQTLTNPDQHQKDLNQYYHFHLFPIYIADLHNH